MNTKQIALEMIKNSKHLRNKLSFSEHLEMYKFFESLNDTEIRQRLNSKGVDLGSYNPTDKDLKYWAGNGLIAASLVIPIPGLTLILMRIRNSMMIPCKTKCVATMKEVGSTDESLCTAECTYLSTKNVVNILEKELKRCGSTKKPKKCQKRLFKLLMTWKPKLAEAQLKLEEKYRHLKYARAKQN